MGIFSVENILGALINSFAYMFTSRIIIDDNSNLKTARFYLAWFIFSLILIINFFFVSGFVRIIVILFSLFLIYKLIFKHSASKSILLSFYIELIIMVSELIFLVFLTLISTTNVNDLVQFYSGTLVANIIISLICIIIGKLPISKSLFQKIVSRSKEIKNYQLFIIISVLLISINIIFGYFYKSVNLFYIIIINTLISIVYFFICFKFLRTENEYFKISDKYNNTLNSLKEYEDILDVYRVSSHENKNQLLMIRNMILKKEKDIPEYIDKIIDNKIKDDEKLMFDTNKIPAGGLRAVVYSKLLVMKDEKIDFNLIVDRKVRTVDLIELGESLMLDVCRITGVFLDNAIEEVKKKDNKKIIVELFTDEDKLCIKISNNFSGLINIEKIYDKGYTTKTNGHGYGLSLVKEIIEKNNKLTNMTSIENGMFTQLLEIKIKY